MVAYIAEWVREIKTLFAAKEASLLQSRIHILVEEIDRLDPRDFPPSVQFEFTHLRMRMRQWAGNDLSHWGEMFANLAFLNHVLDKLSPEESLNPNLRVNIPGGTSPLAAAKDWQQSLGSLLAEFSDACDRFLEVLNSYGGQGSHIIPKAFPFICKTDLREIVERDYRSLLVELIPAGAWKSAVVMAGSILETMLYDQLTNDPARVTAAMASSKAPKKDRGRNVKEITLDTAEDEWRLIDLIDVCLDLKILPPAYAQTIHHVLRDYRNFVHPRKEIRAGHPCTESEADLAKGALGAVINHLS